jgi:hypothetical protein
MKITTKFDNNGEGYSRFSFKTWLQKKNLEEIPKLYLLISNRENIVMLEKIDESYNNYLAEENFRKAAGIEDIIEVQEHEKCITGKIKKFEEDRNLRNKKILTPKTISVQEIDRKELPDIPRDIITNDDILLGITAHIDDDIRKIVQTLGSCIIEFQFRIFLEGFLSDETLKSWESSSESWSVDIDIHKRRGFKNIYNYFENNPVYKLKYPKNIDIWINIPHNHLFIASSPAYKNAIKLKPEDIKYKTYRQYKERKFYRKFETREGDYSVKMSNNEGIPKEFSLICVSPFLPEEAPQKLRKDIKDFEKRSKEFVTWRGIIGPFALLIAAMSMVISATIALTLGEEIKFNSRIITILIESFIYALFIWALGEFVNLSAIMLGKFDERLEKIALRDKKWLLILIVVILLLRLWN